MALGPTARGPLPGGGGGGGAKARLLPRTPPSRRRAVLRRPGRSRRPRSQPSARPLRSVPSGLPVPARGLRGPTRLARSPPSDWGAASGSDGPTAARNPVCGCLSSRKRQRGPFLARLQKAASKGPGSRRGGPQSHLDGNLQVKRVRSQSRPQKQPFRMSTQHFEAEVSILAPILPVSPWLSLVQSQGLGIWGSCAWHSAARPSFYPVCVQLSIPVSGMAPGSLPCPPACAVIEHLLSIYCVPCAILRAGESHTRLPIYSNHHIYHSMELFYFPVCTVLSPIPTGI